MDVTVCESGVEQKWTEDSS